MFTSPGAIAFQFGPLAIRWYGILIATGVLLGTTLAHREAIRRGQDPDKVLNAIVLTVLVALLGARVYYVLFNWEYYVANPGRILAVWEGGLAIHGGLIAGALATLLYCRRAGLALPLTLDIMAPGVAVGQAIGRWGNFSFQEAFGCAVVRWFDGSRIPELPIYRIRQRRKPSNAFSLHARNAYLNVVNRMKYAALRLPIRVPATLDFPTRFRWVTGTSRIR